MNDSKEIIRRFILSTYLTGERAENLRDDTPLQTSGILDSLAIVSLASFIEKDFQVKLTVQDVSIERFDCIEDIAALIEKRQAH